MKSFFAIIVLIGFTVVILFGAFLMVHSGNASSHASCLPMLLWNDECKTNINPLEYVRVHLGALTDFMNGIPTFGAMVTLVVLTALLYTVSSSKFYKSFLVSRERYFFTAESKRLVVQKKFLKWMARHEKRDPSFAFAVRT